MLDSSFIVRLHKTMKERSDNRIFRAGTVSFASLRRISSSCTSCWRLLLEEISMDSSAPTRTGDVTLRISSDVT